MDPEHAEAPSRPWSALFALAAVAVLYLARPVLMPVGLAILLTFVLAPVVMAIERRVRSRALAVVITTVLLTATSGGLALLVEQQLVAFADDLPTYRDTIVRKVRAVQSGPQGLMGRVADTLSGIGREISQPATKPDQPPPAPGAAPGAAAPGAPPSETPPTEAPPAKAALPEARGPAPLTGSLWRAIIELLASGAIVILLVVMMLMSRESIRDRIIRLAGLNQIGLTTQTLEEAGARVGRYLRAQLLINTIHASAVGAAMFLVGLPSAALWGLMAGVLRFIPILGPWLGAAVPAALAIAVFDDWYPLVVVISVFAVLEIVHNVVLEPWLFGSSTGLSNIGMVLAIIFWTWIWGAMGLVLAVPMTACLVVFARQVPQLNALSVLLGDEPVLSEPMRYYQRLLCRDEDEAAAILAAVAPERDPADVLDEIVIPGLAAARADLRRALITRTQAARIAVAARDLAIDWLADHEGPPPPENRHPPTARVACIPASDELDEAAAALLAHLLKREGLGVIVVSAALLFSEKIAAAQEPDVGLIVVSSVEPSNGLQTRRIGKTLLRKRPGIPLIVATWGVEAASAAGPPTDDGAGASPRVSTNREAVVMVNSLLADQRVRDPVGEPAEAKA